MKITRDDNFVYITDGATTKQILIDDSNEYYLKVKQETNNFTENMIEETEIDYILNLDFRLSMIELGL